MEKSQMPKIVSIALIGETTISKSSLVKSLVQRKPSTNHRPTLNQQVYKYDF
jgi:hypothetical protein